MAELIYSIEKVFGDYLTSGQIYNIPEYQRGYKWNNQQINQLLDDINKFDTGGGEDLFYCLQNITLVPVVKENKLNVVDGQQRITTIALLLAYLQEIEKVKGKIFYAVRDPSNVFIQKVISNEEETLKDIIDSIGFEEFVNTKIKFGKDYDYQDIYFMYSAIRTIDEWFKWKKKEPISVNTEAFKEKLLKNVKLIVNCIENVNEQELFMNLNAGRVQLDGADLIRAILITRVAKQEMEEYDSAEVNDVVRLNERRIRIGWELDEINAWWSKDDVKEYFKLFTNLKTGGKETIKFDDLKHPINLLYKIWAEVEEENEIKLSLFEMQNKKPLDLYISIILLHRILRDWYEDREIYHYLGLLFSQRGVKFRFNSLWNKWNEEHTSRSEFILYLKHEIQESVFGKEPDTNTEKEETGIQYWFDKIKDYNSENPTNWYEIPELEKILLTLDIIEHSKKKEMELPFLNPKYFKNYNEDKEHIYPGTPKDIKDIATLSKPEEQFGKYIQKLNEGYEGDKVINWSFPAHEWETYTEEDKSIKLLDLKEEIHQKRPINSIGNLVLLHYSINRGFGNDYYADKRISVIKNTENGEYVRQHTLKVFVKQTTESNDLNNWTMQDIRQNADKILNTLKVFFNFNREEKV